ncbi:MAG: hypothetical protein ACRD68_15930, partial [Pyrinomonadaceae bacterium]
MNRKPNSLLACVLLSVIAQASFAQEQISSNKSATEKSEPVAEASEAMKADGEKAGVKAETAAAAQGSSECKVCRWFELQTAVISGRYRFVENSSGVTTADQLQHAETFKGRFKFDAEGRYTVNALVGSGSGFTSSWNNTGLGTGRGSTNLYLKQLYFAAKPVRGVEVQYGGIGLLRGESTEITSYDNDGYLVGQRLSVKRPKEVFFDEIAVTYAY